MARSHQQARKRKDPASQEEKRARRAAKKDRRKQKWQREAAANREGWNGGDGRPGGYTLAPKENKLYEKYYKGTGLIPEDEWDAFLAKLRQPLPSTFRVTGYKKESRELLRIIRDDYLSKLMDIKIEGQEIKPPQCLPWYPDGLAWQINLDRKSIRTCETLKALHQFLIQETESGNISRQEAVSMIPPLVLDVQPHHKVLDMCAAPGSKTAQLIEMLHADDSKPIPEGVVIANDSDNKRCYLMVHQIRRLESTSFMVINHDAAHLPNLRLSPPDAVREDKKVLKFDRILADVPCSGDGTLRKNPDAWYKWNSIGACHLHNLQARILRRGLEMLAVGGRLVYSTCSLNPIEDEAVVANLLSKTEDSVVTVNVSDRLPGLLYEKGVSSWRIMSREGDWYSSFEEVPESLHTQIRPNLFPPENASTMGLENCIRILPHKQDTGGFFVAVLEKKAECPWLLPVPRAPTSKTDSSTDVKDSSQTEATPAAPSKEGEEGASDNGAAPSGAQEHEEESEAGSAEPPKKKQRRFGFKEDPFVFFEANDSMWPPISEFFGITDFPVDQLMVRCNEGKRRNLYFTSKLVKDILKFNEDRFKFINLGLKVLARSESQYVSCDFRPVQDGISTLFPFLSRRIIQVCKEDVIVLLSCENPYCNKLSKATQAQMEDLAQGGCIFVYTPDDRPDSPQCKLIITGWKGKVSCRSFLAKNDRGHILRLCGTTLKTKEEIMAEKAAKVAAIDAAEAKDKSADNDAAEVKDKSADNDAAEAKDKTADDAADVKDETADNDAAEVKDKTADMELNMEDVEEWMEEEG